MPHVSSHWQRTALVAAAAALPTLASAAFYDVSQIVLGTSPVPALHDGPTTPCGTACSYVQLSGANMEGSYTLPATPQPTVWPALFGAAVPGKFTPIADYATLQAAPAGAHYPPEWPNPQQTAAVRWGGSFAPWDLTVESWADGSGAAATSYAIRIATPPEGPARRTYLDFKVPKLMRDEQVEYGYPPDLYVRTSYPPPRHQSRAAVDVYIDGLPVWSSEDLRLLPQRYKAVPYKHIAQQWDRALDGSTVTLYLGSLPPRSVRTAVVVLRNDLRSDSFCWTGRDALFGGTLYSCYGRRDTLTLPVDSTVAGGIPQARPAIQVYTR